jgi:hypothetical protein
MPVVLDTCLECECALAQGEAKEEMMLAMGLNTEEEGSAMAFLRRGYKVQPWPACGPASDLNLKHPGVRRDRHHHMHHFACSSASDD